MAARVGSGRWLASGWQIAMSAATVELGTHGRIDGRGTSSSFRPMVTRFFHTRRTW
jgi:hypothetical protein